MNKIKLLTLFAFIGLVSFSSLGLSSSFAYPPFLKQSKDLGFEAKDCTFCHEKAAGGKGWNKRGLWLKDQKKERKAPVVDVRWLKNYNPEGEQTKAETDTNKGAESKPDAPKKD